MKELASLGVRSHYDLKEGMYMYVCMYHMYGRDDVEENEVNNINCWNVPCLFATHVIIIS